MSIPSMLSVDSTCSDSKMDSKKDSMPFLTLLIKMTSLERKKRGNPWAENITHLRIREIPLGENPALRMISSGAFCPVFIDTHLLERHFNRIGARVRVRGPWRWQQDDYQIDVGSDRAGEFFDFSVRRTVDFQLPQSRADQQHLLLLASDGKRFLAIPPKPVHGELLIRAKFASHRL
jgi:hypothetical protein